MRLTPPGKKKLLQTDNLTITYGGAEANVSCALAHWGEETAHVTSFPNNALGDAAIATLRKLNVSTRYMLQQEGRLGLYFVEAGAMNRATAITYDRLPSAFSAIDAHTFDWERILDGVEWFHWTGITPAISQGAADALLEALNVAEKKGIHVSADINYRMGLWQYGKTPGEVLAPLVEKSTVVVAAASDTESIFGITADNYADLAKAMKQRFPKMQMMLASKRTGVSADHNTLGGIYWNGQDVLESKVHDVDNIVDRIGSGDSFISGFIYGYFNGYSDQDKIEYAAAAAVLKHSIEGDHNLASVAEIRNLMSGETGGRVKR